MIDVKNIKVLSFDKANYDACELNRMSDDELIKLAMDPHGDGETAIMSLAAYQNAYNSGMMHCADNYIVFVRSTIEL